jgi:drug/metabolite transporter (DMT)-like permease
VKADVKAETPRAEHVTLGILLMIGATFMFSVSSAASKVLVADYPPGEVMFVRTAISLIVVAMVILPRTGFAVYRTSKPGSHVLRAMSQTASQTCIILAFSLMPFASVVAISFAAPLVATLASAYFLREPVGGARWIALIVGFLGVLIVTNPGAETFQIGALFALGNAILYGTVTAGVRGMSGTESTDTLMMYQMTLLTLTFGCMLPLGARWPASGTDVMWMLVLGFANVIGQYWWTRALHVAPTSAVSPFYYLMLVWSLLIGFGIWGDLPTASLLIGSAVVVGSGLFLLWRESRKIQPKTQPLADIE